ncbi:FAD/NAD(P)-binding protein [Mycobacterium sp. CPCC 205372]|uniref:FAD/NAD(P)-binding protein n=1 Tax=Mycobacterium hippophais TaxID=3016340 RepID=A0ABT4PT97_9MYCO|nr:FAD/NAD(P)-binding protein [Mycobacterium hippophais]MCZ8379781.1 FAD/NAD(P)-binding protein [Mycobacterium hippophais]
MPTDAAARQQPARVVVVGGGFSGTMTAVNLARLRDVPLDLTVVNEREPVGRGIAYRRRRPEYLLNVAARNMSAFPDEPDHFLRWVSAQPQFEAVPQIDLRERFIPRQTYGDYLRALTQRHLSTGPAPARLVVGTVVDVEPGDLGCLVRLADGSAIEADRVVLATGNETPAALPGAESLTGHPAWVGDPWQAWEERLPERNSAVVVLGTGLTAVDAIITLRTIGWRGDIHAVSRHGWLPHGHFRGIEYPEFPPPDVDLTTLGLDRLVALVRAHCAELHERNAHPAIIVDKLRAQTQRIWSSFTTAERLAFAQHHAARWNVFRHRISPDIHAQLTHLQLTGQLRVRAAGIEKLEDDGAHIRVHLADGETLTGDVVINATGPSTKLTGTSSVLLQNLLRRGLIAPDATNMGVAVDHDHIALTADGDRSAWLLALGPLLRGTYWETVAVPELRGQARRVAETILDRPRADEVEGPAQLEYMV